MAQICQKFGQSLHICLGFDGKIASSEKSRKLCLSTSSQWIDDSSKQLSNKLSTFKFSTMILESQRHPYYCRNGFTQSETSEIRHIYPCFLDKNMCARQGRKRCAQRSLSLLLLRITQ